MVMKQRNPTTRAGFFFFHSFSHLFFILISFSFLFFPFPFHSFLSFFWSFSFLSFPFSFLSFFFPLFFFFFSFLPFKQNNRTQGTGGAGGAGGAGGRGGRGGSSYTWTETHGCGENSYTTTHTNPGGRAGPSGFVFSFFLFVFLFLFLFLFFLLFITCLFHLLNFCYRRSGSSGTRGAAGDSGRNGQLSYHVQGLKMKGNDLFDCFVSFSQVLFANHIGPRNAIYNELYDLRIKNVVLREQVLSPPFFPLPLFFFPSPSKKFDTIKFSY